MLNEEIFFPFCDVLLLNECHIASAKQIFIPELIPAKTNGDNVKSLSFFTKNEQNTLFRYHRLLFCLRCETDIRTRIISGPQSYFMINFFAIERHEEMTSKKCSESKHCYILY